MSLKTKHTQEKSRRATGGNGAAKPTRKARTVGPAKVQADLGEPSTPRMQLQRYVRTESLPPVDELEPLAGQLPVVELFEFRDWDMVRQFYTHSHADLYHLDHFTSGEGLYIIDNVPYPIDPHTFFFIPPGVPHRLAGAEKTTLVTLSIKFRYHLIGHDFLPYAFKAEEGAVPRLRFLLKSVGDLLYDDAKHALPASLSLAQALLILHDASRSEGANHGEHVRVIAAKRYMEEHFAEPLTLDDIAAKAGVGGAHLCRLFKSETGSTPFEYLRKVRLMRAKYWLSQSREKVSTIAAASGFGTAQELNRTFQRLEKMSPREFRKRVAVTPETPAAGKRRS